MSLENKKLLTVAAELFQYYRKRVQPDVVEKHIFKNGGIELHLGHEVVAKDFSMPLIEFRLDVSKCYATCDVLDLLVLEAASEEQKDEGMAWLWAYYSSLFLACHVLTPNYCMPGRETMASVHLFSHAMNVGDTQYQRMVSDLLIEVRNALFPRELDPDDYDSGKAKIIEVCIICLSMKMLMCNIKPIDFDWQKYIDVAREPSMKDILARHLVKHINEIAMPASYDLPIPQIIALCGSLSSFLAAHEWRPTYSLKDLGIEIDVNSKGVVPENDPVGGNTSIRAESQPKTDGNKGQEK